MEGRSPGKYERLCAERHARDLALARHPGGHPKGFTFDEAAGDRVVQFVEGYCRHIEAEWAGQPLLLEDWQKDIVRQAFGWKRRDGTRRFRLLYCEVPRKNGKSTLMSALGLYLLLADGEPGAQIYTSATKKEQARIVWEMAAKMVKANPELKRFVAVFRNSLTVERLGSKFEPLSADSGTLDGLNPHGNLVDELHAHKDRGVWDVLDTAMGARRQPMTITITTAGTYDPESIGWQMHDTACKVLDGVIEDDSMFAFISAADEGDDYFALSTHKKANPGYGISLKPDDMERQSLQAQREASFFNEFLRLRLNVWTQQVKRWLSLEKWTACEPELVEGVDLRALRVVRELALEGRACVGGLDLSSKWDLCALTLLFEGEGDSLDAVCRFWLPEATVETYARKGHRHYATWAREGWITLTPGNVIDYEFIRAEVNALSKRYRLQEVAFDPWGATDVSNRLQGDGQVMVECRQGFRTLSEPSKDLEARVLAGRVRHGGNPVLRFCVSNAVVSVDSAGNIKPDKQKAVQRIDGVVSTVMALSRVIAAKPAATSYLEHSDIVELG